jgi:NADPH2 dehydrogenase
MTSIFDPITVKGLELSNRVMMSPMCQYQAYEKDGSPGDWHFVHYTSRAIGGVGLIMIEMTNVEPKGRITEHCLGLWSEDHISPFNRLIESCHQYGSKVGIQIAHAGRKSTIEGEDIVAPSSIPFSEQSAVPRELSIGEIKNIITKFGNSTKLAVQAGVDTVELHGAHGYLLHQFMSPFSNKRTDEYGEYSKFPLEVIKIVRDNMPDDMPLIMRISATEYDEGGYNFEHMKAMIPSFIEAGVDVFDVSTGGNGPTRPATYPAYQVQYAEKVRKLFNIPVISVGRLENPLVAEAVVGNEQTDMVAIGKGLLRKPYWMKEASRSLNQEVKLPGVYDMGI